MFFFFLFKQKTAYEMRISDWSSDVCSSDLMVSRTADSSVMSQAICRPSAPVPERDRQTTSRPRSTSTRAIVWPMPLDPPVTINKPSAIFELRFALFLECPHAFLGITRPKCQRGQFGLKLQPRLDWQLHPPPNTTRPET